jgi:hypothetical protein
VPKTEKKPFAPSVPTLAVSNGQYTISNMGRAVQVLVDYSKSLPKYILDRIKLERWVFEPPRGHDLWENLFFLVAG